MKIGVLAAGITPDELLDQHGSYAEMIIKLLKHEDESLSFDVFDVFDVRLDQFPDNPECYDAWVITGSRDNVSDNFPWMKKLKTLILTAYKSKQRMIGICFGHQIVADALGGKVERYEGGWGLGLHEYELTSQPAFMQTVSPKLSLNAVHQDQVLEKPESAQRVLSSDFCLNAALVYGDLIFTVQAHPEFNMAFEEALLRLKSGKPFPVEMVENSIKEMHGKKTDSAIVAKWIVSFLNQPVH